MRFVEDQYGLPLEMTYDRSVNSIGDMLDTSQTPVAPLIQSDMKCPKSKTAPPPPYQITPW